VFGHEFLGLYGYIKMGIMRRQKEYQYGMKEGFDWV
jgi:hypothetical protein